MLPTFTKLCMRVHLRPSYGGRPLKDAVRELDGQSILVMVAWMQDDEDGYPGEQALTPADEGTARLFRRAGMQWLSSGDAEFLYKVEG